MSILVGDTWNAKEVLATNLGVVLRAIAGLGSVASLFAAGAFIVAGFVEMVTGRNAPGWLGGKLFYTRGWAKEPNWNKMEWRRNGFFVLGFGLSFIIISISLFLVAIGRLL